MAVWEGNILCNRITIHHGDNGHIDIVQAQVTIEAVSQEFGNDGIVSYTTYQHMFNDAAPCLFDPLARVNLGLFHALTALELESNAAIVLEKFNDKIEMMIGRGPLFLTYSKLFRANGKERPGEWRREVSSRPVREMPKRQLDTSFHNVRDLTIWLNQKKSAALQLGWRELSRFCK